MENTLIFEHYEDFLKDHSDDLANPTGAIRMLQDTGMFAAFTDSLTEGMDGHTRDSVLGILNRQREMVLEEAANVPASTFTHGLR
ncbi:MAG: hypothetical protein GY870_16570 [archaeon]|nr:hypothetical protein [archaeon]